jgi:uncharacterized membrane protein YgcG
MMKKLLIAFGVLLALLTLISAFGGSLSSEGFEEEETMPPVYDATETFWQEQQNALVESYVDDTQQTEEDNANLTAEHTQSNVETFASCGNVKENFTDADLDVEPFEEDQIYSTV